MKVIPNSKDLKVTNLGQLPHGTGANYLEVIESHIAGEYIAKCWRRKLPPNTSNGIFISLNPNNFYDTAITILVEGMTIVKA